MKNTFKEWYSVKRAKKPRSIVLFVILAVNILFMVVSAVFLSSIPLPQNKDLDFFEALYSTVTMVLDAGCISAVIEEVGQASVVLAIGCLAIVIIGMIIFTGAVIGYITNYISGFIESTNAGSKPVRASNHVVILNWNSRASEIVNDLLYYNGNKEEQLVIVLANSGKEDIEKEIEERLSDTVITENKAVKERYKDLPPLSRFVETRRNKFRCNVTYIVRTGDVFSGMQLHDISLEKARSIIILGSDINNATCKFEKNERLSDGKKGNSQTIKTLMQVADITADVSSADDQKIIVEIEDDWTYDIVAKIIERKERDEKCHIVPVRVNQVLGQILSQFSLMPELNLCYSELFSNKGDTFYPYPHELVSDSEFISKTLSSNRRVIPLTIMNSRGKNYAYYATDSEKNIKGSSIAFRNVAKSDYKVNPNEQYWIEQKNIVILGHNSRFDDIMKGFASFFEEWSFNKRPWATEHVEKEDDVLRILIIDDAKNLEKLDTDKYKFSVETVPASIFDRDKIYISITDFIDANNDETSILILSDDTAANEDIDANAFANLVYVQDIVNDYAKRGDFDTERIDIVVEIINPKHSEIVRNYSVNNVVISNRYISKMMTQIGEKEELYDFYVDILHYDDEEEEYASSGEENAATAVSAESKAASSATVINPSASPEDSKEAASDDKNSSEKYDSKEIYIKRVDAFFKELPAPCTAEEFIRSVYYGSIESGCPEAIVLGYVKPGPEVVLFCGDQRETKVELKENYKLIVFSNH